jgi:hypothetical protein
MLRRPITITVGAWATMLRIQQVGDMPMAIQPDPVWCDPDSDQHATEAAWREFGEVGLVERPGRLDGDALDSLHVLARPQVEYLGVFLADSHRDAVAVATLGSETLVANRTGDAVTLASIRDASLPETLLRHIPDAPPAPVAAVNVRVESDDGNDPYAPPSSSRDARTLTFLTRQRLARQGELYVAARDHYGRRSCSPAIRFQDYDVGRVVVVIDHAFLSIAPATKVQLRDRLRALYRDLIG